MCTLSIITVGTAVVAAGTDWQLTRTCSPWLTASCTSWQLGAGLPESATRARDAGRNTQARGSVNVCGRVETTLGMRGGGFVSISRYCVCQMDTISLRCNFRHVDDSDNQRNNILKALEKYLHDLIFFFNALPHCNHILLCAFRRHANTKLWFPSYLKN